MEYLQAINLDLLKKLQDKAYRVAFFRAQGRDEIALQIRQLREEADLSQSELAKACGMKQSAISRIESADYSSWSYNTLLRVGEALGARVRVKFQKEKDAIAEISYSDALSDLLPSVTMNAEQPIEERDSIRLGAPDPFHEAVKSGMGAQSASSNPMTLASKRGLGPT